MTIPALNFIGMITYKIQEKPNFNDSSGEERVSVNSECLLN